MKKGLQPSDLRHVHIYIPHTCPGIGAHHLRQHAPIFSPRLEVTTCLHDMRRDWARRLGHWRGEAPYHAPWAQKPGSPTRPNTVFRQKTSRFYVLQLLFFPHLMRHSLG